jgi:hypothetical protein
MYRQSPSQFLLILSVEYQDSSLKYTTAAYVPSHLTPIAVRR